MSHSIIEIVDDALNKLEILWSKWQPMPEKRINITGPQSPGIYQVRNRESKNLILFGVGGKCQERMKSLYGGRNNQKKINHVLNNWKVLEYRTMETDCREEAEAVEGLLKAKKNHHLNT